MKSLPYIILALLTILLAAGCTDRAVGPNNHRAKPTTKASSSSLGLVAVTISGIGTSHMTASARPVSALPAVASDISTPEDNSGNHTSQDAGTIQMKSLSNGSFTYGNRPGGYRYFYATFAVRNADVSGVPYQTPRDNLTFIAADITGGNLKTIGHTAIDTLRLFGGTVLSESNARPIANKMIPTGQTAQNGSSEIISTSPDVLQVYTENDVSGITVQNGSLFPYGFVVRSPGVTPGSRALPAGPGPNQYDGVVTFAFKIPLQAQANQDPFEITAIFKPVDDSQTRITQSLQEQTPEGRKALRQRINMLNPDAVTLLPGSIFEGGTYQCNPVRIAGTKMNPTPLVKIPAFSSLSPDPYSAASTFIQAGSDFTADFTADVVHNADGRSFVVRGSQSGRHFLEQAYPTANGQSVTTPTANFLPGEMVEVSLTPRLGLCPNGYVARYRVEVTAGSGHFSKTTNSPFGVASQPVSVALGYLDNDEKLDFVVANSGNDNVSVLLGNGDGTFTTAATETVGNQPSSVALGDLDGDGNLDMVVANSGVGSDSGDENVSVLLGNGDGTFTSAGTESVGDYPVFVALGDLNGDGLLDMAVVNEHSNNVSVLLGNGDGTFTTAGTEAVGASPRKVALGDLNNDGNLDMAVPNGGGAPPDNSVSVLLGDGTGGFGDASTVDLVGSTPVSLALGDLDADGNLDMVVTYGATFIGPDIYDVSVLPGDGTGGFTSPGTPYTIGGTKLNAVALGDLDGDGDLDMAIADRGSGTNPAASIIVLLNDGSGGFLHKAETKTVGDSPSSVALGDLDGDGSLDIVVSNSSSADVYVLLNMQPTVGLLE